jgi:hypothetical protein
MFRINISPTCSESKGKSNKKFSEASLAFLSTFVDILFGSCCDSEDGDHVFIRNVGLFELYAVTTQNVMLLFN